MPVNPLRLPASIRANAGLLTQLQLAPETCLSYGEHQLDSHAERSGASLPYFIAVMGRDSLHAAPYPTVGLRRWSCLNPTYVEMLS